MTDTNPMHVFYVSSYCKRLHCVGDGRPIHHECFVLPPAVIQAEQKGQIWLAAVLIMRSPMKRHRGSSWELQRGVDYESFNTRNPPMQQFPREYETRAKRQR